MNIPVLCSDINVFKEIGAETLFFFDPKSESELANQIEIILKNKEITTKKIEHANARTALFSQENFVRKTMNLYQS